MTRFKTVLRYSSYLFGSKILTRLLYTAFVAFAAVRLGAELFGALAFSLAMVELLSWLGDLGLTRYGARELVNVDPGRRPVLNGQMLALQILSSVVLCAAGLIAIFAWSPGYPKTQLLLMGLVAVLLSGVVNATESALIATQSFFYSAMLTFTGRVIFLSIGFVAVGRGASVIAVMAGFLAAVVTESCLRLYVVARKVAGYSFDFRPSDLKVIVLASLPFAGVALASVVYSQVGVIGLEIFKGDSAVGVYSVAYSLFVPFVWVAIVLAKALFPGQTELCRDDIAAARLNHRQWFRLLIMAGIPLAVATTFLAGPALSFFPEEYARSSTVLIILMWSIPIVLVSPMQLNVMQVIGREKQAARVVTLSTVLTVILDVILIPLFGVVGAAVASVSGALVREVQVYEVVRRSFFQNAHYAALVLRPAVGGAVMTGAVILLWGLGPWLATAIGLVAYVGTLFATGGLKLAELKSLARS